MVRRRLDLGTLPRLLLAMLIVVLMAFAVTACGDDDDDSGGGGGGQSEQASENKIASFAIVAPEKGSDYGWNQQSVEAAEKIA